MSRLPDSPDGDGASGSGRPIVIVDLDGTIADVRHRLHHINGPKRKNWKAFFEAMDRDAPIPSIIEKVRDLARTSDIVILTGRPETYRRPTITWLSQQDIPYSRLLMRRSGDRRPDFTAKEELLRELALQRVTLAIDDRPPVCEMYRRNGLEVLEVASDEGNKDVNEVYRQHPD